MTPATHETSDENLQFDLASALLMAVVMALLAVFMLTLWPPH